MEYKRAVRENTNVLIALAGASGSGKTYSAMQLATGICGGEPFAVVDTEARRALHYADQFNFEHVALGPPFTPERYTSAAKPLAARGFGAIVIDSASHEWEGEGGVLEWADAEEAAGRRNIAKWIKPKAAHRKWVNGLLQCGINLIICLRAAEKIHVDDSGPKTKVTNEGWLPICEKRFMYEMTISLTFAPLRPGVVDLGYPHKIEDQHRMMFPPGQHIGVTAGEQLGAWARGDAVETPDKALWDRARRAAHDGSDGLRALRDGLSEDERTKVRPIAHELNRTAKLADQNRGGPQTDPSDLPASDINWKTMPGMNRKETRMFHAKGHMKEIEIAGGTLALVMTGNPLELSQKERDLVFSLVDRIADFENHGGRSDPKV